MTMGDLTMSEPREEIEVELPEELYEHLVRMASERGKTIDEIVEDFLREEIERVSEHDPQASEE